MAVDLASVNWPAARRAMYAVTQSFRYEYPEPIRDLSHRLVVIPPERFGDQRRLWHELSVGLDGVQLEAKRDRFGNVVADVFAPRAPRAESRGWPGFRARHARPLQGLRIAGALRLRPPARTGRNACLGRGAAADQRRHR